MGKSVFIRELDLTRASEEYYKKLPRSQQIQAMHNGNSLLQTWNEYLNSIDPKYPQRLKSLKIWRP
jgi:hypothetical protein